MGVCLIRHCVILRGSDNARYTAQGNVEFMNFKESKDLSIFVEAGKNLGDHSLPNSKIM